MIEIRPLGREEIQAVSDIEERTFSMPWKPEDFLEMVEADYAYYFVAICDGQVAGCCGLRDIAGEGEIVNVVVDAPFRKQGIGKTLLKRTLKEAEALGITECTLEVRVSNTPAIRLYESLGFRAEGVRPDFYDKPKEDALIMWKR